MLRGVAFRCKLCGRYVPEEAVLAAFEAGDKTSLHYVAEPESGCSGMVITVAKPPPESEELPELEISQESADVHSEYIEILFYTPFKMRYDN